MGQKFRVRVDVQIDSRSAGVLIGGLRESISKSLILLSHTK